MDGLAYSEKQLDLLTSVVTLLLPLSTGFVVLVAAGLPRLAAGGLLKTIRQRRMLVASFVLIVCSIGFWSSCLAFLVDTARPFDLPPGVVPTVNLRLLNAEWQAALPAPR